MASDTVHASDGSGATSVEIERKYDVDDAAGVPAFVGVGPIAVIEKPEVRELDAVYYDTDDLALARAHVAVRRREGGADAGWHIKRDAREGRTEQHWPLGDVSGSEGAAPVPSMLVAEVQELTRGAQLRPVARVRNRRIARRLLDAAGYPVAEFCDDHVTGENLRTSGAESWREWEVELAAAAPESEKGRAELLDGLEAAVVAAGATPAAASSKLERALGAG